MRYLTKTRFIIDIEFPMFESSADEALRQVPAMINLSINVPATLNGDKTITTLTYLGGTAEEIE